MDAVLGISMMRLSGARDFPPLDTLTGMRTVSSMRQRPSALSMRPSNAHEGSRLNSETSRRDVSVAGGPCTTRLTLFLGWAEAAVEFDCSTTLVKVPGII